MNAGQEDYNEGNNLTFALGMQLLCSQTSAWIRYPQAHTKSSWDSEQLPHFLAGWQKPHKCLVACRLGLKMLNIFKHPTQRARSAALSRM